MSAVAAKVKEEFEKLLPPTLYFFIALHLVAIIRVLLLKGDGIPLATSFTITMGALILGKAVLLADMLPFINRYPDKPLIFNVTWKTVVYALVALLLHYLERLVDFWREAGGFIAGNERLLAEMVWPHFWAVQIILVVLVLAYCAMAELIRVLGAGRVRQIFFGPLPAAAAGTRQLPPPGITRR
jgi:hypothetical protein